MVPPAKKTSPARAPRRKREPPRRSASIADLVREGVERFILKDANMMSFMKAVRAAATKGGRSSHPLTGAAFRQIVREAVRKRKRRIGRSARKQSKSGGATSS
jgi:DNA-binding NarL/FixJ family response regulator